MTNFSEDVKRALHVSRVRKFTLPFRLMQNPGLIAVACFRSQAWFHARGMRRMASTIRTICNSVTGADLLPGATIGGGIVLPHPTGIVVGSGVVIGRNCTILQNVTIGEKFANSRGPHFYPTLEDDVVVGAGAVLLGDIRIGSGAVIGANAVVLANVPPCGVAVGSPARVAHDTL